MMNFGKEYEKRVPVGKASIKSLKIQAYIGTRYPDIQDSGRSST